MATLTIEEGLVYKLLNTSGVSALVGTRVYAILIPQNTSLPCIVITRISTPRVHSHDSSGSTGTAYPRFQIDTWGATYHECKDAQDAIRAALNGFQGTITSGADSVSVQCALVDSEEASYDGEVNLYRSRADYVIWHVEA